MTKRTSLRFFQGTMNSIMSGPVQSMSLDDEIAWKITRERHPQYYKKD